MKKKLSYDEFRARTQFDKTELLAFAYGNLVEDAPADFVARLPTPPMDRRSNPRY